jgi:hypothetical protein
MNEQPPLPPPQEEPVELTPFEALSNTQKAIAAVHCSDAPISLEVVVDIAGLQNLSFPQLEEIEAALSPYQQYGKKPDGSVIPINAYDASYIRGRVTDYHNPDDDAPRYYYVPISAYVAEAREQDRVAATHEPESFKAFRKQKADKWKASLRLLGIEPDSVEKHHTAYMEKGTQDLFDELGLDF